MFKKWIEKIVRKVLKEDNVEINSGSIEMSVECGLNDRYLYDFKSNRNFGGTWVTNDVPTNGVPQGAGLSIGGTDGNNEIVTEKPPIKITIKPIDVLHELERRPKPFDVEMLDEKMEVLRDKEELIEQHYAKREVSAMLERLENRKLYEEYREFFEKFDNTDDGKIHQLLKKYELVMEKSDIFIPDFPKEAVDIMKDYAGMMEKVCDKKPIFYVIAEKEQFVKAYDVRDPILLVQSPFGFYYQILGAWDKELVCLDEL